MSRPIYLDYAAATPIDPIVIDAMRPYWQDKFFNPSSIYLQAAKVRQELESARSQIAAILGSKPNEVIFTAGATEANNLVIRGVCEQFVDGNIIVSAIEHESVLMPAHLYDFKEAPVTDQG